MLLTKNMTFHLKCLFSGLCFLYLNMAVTMVMCHICLVQSYELISQQVCKSALQTLSSADLEDLPVIVKFILRTVTPSTSLEVSSVVNGGISSGGIVFV